MKPETYSKPVVEEHPTIEQGTLYCRNKTPDAILMCIASTTPSRVTGVVIHSPRCIELGRKYENFLSEISYYWGTVTLSQTKR